MMPLTRSFRDTVVDRAKRDPEFRAALVEEAFQAFVDGDEAVARSLLRDVINGTIGFHTLSQTTGVPEKSLMRMVGKTGNPRLASIAAILKALTQHVGIKVTAHAETLAAVHA
jgi:DNA-binding phage protein